MDDARKKELIWSLAKNYFQDVSDIVWDRHVTVIKESMAKKKSNNTYGSDGPDLRYQNYQLDSLLGTKFYEKDRELAFNILRIMRGEDILLEKLKSE